MIHACCRLKRNRPPVLQAATAAAELAPLAHQQQPPPQQQGGAQICGSNWQKKGGGAALAGPAAAAAAAGPWAEALGSGALLAAAAGGSGLDGTDLELGAAEAAAAAARGGPRQELVVVASLLTKPPNLAGLARTCEVFRWGGRRPAMRAAARLPLLTVTVGDKAALGSRVCVDEQPGQATEGIDWSLCVHAPAGPARWCWATCL